MKKHRVNYNEIADLFDVPIRDHAVDAHLSALLAEHPEYSLHDTMVLDIGCGTGKQLLSNHEAFPEVRMVGLDPFDRMLAIARRRCEAVHGVVGDGAALPFRSSSFHFISNQFSYHHVRQKEDMIREVFRVLKPGGRYAMINMDPWSMEEWIVYRYFPEAMEIDRSDFFPVDIYKSLMTKAGFINLKDRRNHQSTQEDLSDFYAYATQRHNTSQLMAISNTAYGAGVRRIAQDLAAAGTQKAVIESEFSMITIVGEKQE